MVAKAYRSYTASFEGLSKEVWWLALVAFINRAGTMVVPFLSLYLTEARGFDINQVGWIMVTFGIGSFVGSWAGGKLTDLFGYYKVMLWTLVISGVLFIGLQWFTSFVEFCIAIFVLTCVADSFRPASFVALNAYSKPENRTRSLTLIRLAINLGFSFGPAFGGFIITFFSYGGLFWVDGITCVAAGLFVWFILQPKKTRVEEKEEVKGPPRSPYRDGPYLLFLLATFLTGFAFLQFLSSIPLFYKQVHHLSEQSIGWLLAFNGILIFVFEMPLIKALENSKLPLIRILIYGTFLLMASFLVLNLTNWSGVLVISMFLMTVGEMLNFPFMSRFALDRADKGKPGSYMGLYAMTFSLAHIIGMKTGLDLIDALGFHTTWIIMAASLGLTVLSFVVLARWVKREQQLTPAVD